MENIAAAVAALQALVTFIEKVDPNAASNPLMVDLQKVLTMLQAL
jgi:hypothetical protein